MFFINILHNLILYLCYGHQRELHVLTHSSPTRRSSDLGSDGQDTLIGGSEEDYLSGGYDNDQRHGDAGSDQRYGGAGDDQLSGGTGDEDRKSTRLNSSH